MKEHNYLKILINYLTKLKDRCPKQVFDHILINTPKIFQSCTRIFKVDAKKHPLYGRRFESSMFSYDISTCHSCGRICIFLHDNLLLKYNCNIIKPRNFVSKKYDTWKYCCNNFCSEEQFYCSKRPPRITIFQSHHNGLLPWGFLDIQKINLIHQYVIFVITILLMKMVTTYTYVFYVFNIYKQYT